MRAIDTNVIIRFLTRDDERQAEMAARIIGHEPIFVAKTVLLEVEWVLRGVYDMPVQRVIPRCKPYGLPSLVVEDGAAVAKALDWANNGMDFADALHLASARGCDSLLTFDRQFVRSGKRGGGIPVRLP